MACRAPAYFVADGTDCDDTNGSVWATPGEAEDLLLMHDPITATTTLTWDSPADTAGSVLTDRYDTLRSPLPADFDAAATCVEIRGSDYTSLDAATVRPGEVFHYLVRAVNYCPDGIGTLGAASNGAERVGRACP